MKGIENQIYLGVGYVSDATILGKYYQDISPAIVHINKGVFAQLDEIGVPFLEDNGRNYAPVLIIQYALMCHDLLLSGENIEANTNKIKICLNWLEQNKEVWEDSVVWRSIANKQYDLEEGWISGMYQGQAISLYLRAYQLFNEDAYLETAQLIYNSFKYDYKDGGFKRIDEHGCIWFEEYPSKKPSYVLNGYIYAILGIYDLYRVTKNEDVRILWNECLNTLKVNLHKYDVWYWSVYDQLKEELVSVYYQKNVHIPLMEIMYLITNEDFYRTYAVKWEKNLRSSFHSLVVKIMYRVKPRLKRIK